MNAAWGGYLQCLKYAHENGCPWDSRTTTVAKNNVVKVCLEYALANGCPE